MSDNPHINNFLNEFTKQVGPHNFKQCRDEALSSRTCVQCAGDATEFKDELSAKEYEVTALCQNCQDNFFG